MHYYYKTVIMPLFFQPKSLSFRIHMTCRFHLFTVLSFVLYLWFYFRFHRNRLELRYLAKERNPVEAAKHALAWALNLHYLAAGLRQVLIALCQLLVVAPLLVDWHYQPVQGTETLVPLCLLQILGTNLQLVKERLLCVLDVVNTWWQMYRD